MSLDAFKGRDLQNFQAILNEFLSDGVTDARAIQDRISNHFTIRRKTKRLSMSPEARKKAREAKREAVKRIKEKSENRPDHVKPEPTTDTCPECGKKDWRVSGERQDDGSIWWYEGCADCRYIQPIEVK